MSYEAYLAETFQRCIKILKKKYRKVKNGRLQMIRAGFYPWIIFFFRPALARRKKIYLGLAINQ